MGPGPQDRPGRNGAGSDAEDNADSDDCQGFLLPRRRYKPVDNHRGCGGGGGERFCVPDFRLHRDFVCSRCQRAESVERVRIAVQRGNDLIR